MKKKIALLGCGGVAERWYLKGLSGEKDNYELVSVCDINLEKAKETAKKYNIPNYFTTLDDLIYSKPDLIVVLTRHKDHYSHIKEILNANINVYSEKPFAENSKEGFELVKLAADKNLVFGSAPQIMLSSRNQKIKELIDSKTIGDITLARVSGSNMGPSDRKGINFDPEWFYKDGGSIKSLGIYNLSAIQYILGTPLVVSGFSGISIPKREVMYGPVKGKTFNVTAPDNEVAILDFGNGTYVLFDGSYSVMNPPRYEFEIHGTKGSIFSGGFGGPESVVLQLREQEPIFVGPNDDCHIKWNLSWGVEKTVQSLIDGSKNILDAKHALETLKIIDAINQSQISGKHIKIK